MKKILLFILLALLVLPAISYAISDNAQKLCAITYLTTSGTWHDLGDEIACNGYDDLIIAANLSINNGTDVNFRALGKTSRGDLFEYNLPIKDETSTKTNIDQHTYELTDDTDQRIMLDFAMEGIPYIQIQGKCTYSSGVASCVESWYWRKRDN